MLTKTHTEQFDTIIERYVNEVNLAITRLQTSWILLRKTLVFKAIMFCTVNYSIGISENSRFRPVAGTVESRVHAKTGFDLAICHVCVQFWLESNDSIALQVEFHIWKQLMKNHTSKNVWFSFNDAPVKVNPDPPQTTHTKARTQHWELHPLLLAISLWVL